MGFAMENGQKHIHIVLSSEEFEDLQKVCKDLNVTQKDVLLHSIKTVIYHDNTSG